MKIPKSQSWTLPQERGMSEAGNGVAEPSEEVLLGGTSRPGNWRGERKQAGVAGSVLWVADDKTQRAAGWDGTRTL